MEKRKVLIICTGNSCRSQIAEGLINRFLGDKWQAFSAGLNPSKVNPRAIQVMDEIGIDIKHHHSKSLDEFLQNTELELVITVCDNAKERCPVFPRRVKTIHMGFDDPAPFTEMPDEKALPEFRKTRDEIRERLLDQLRKM